MKYANRADLTRLNDLSIDLGFNALMPWELMEGLSDDAHVLGWAWPHGKRPKSRITDPSHMRTVWYLQLRDRPADSLPGLNFTIFQPAFSTVDPGVSMIYLACSILDIPDDEVSALPDIPDTGSLLPPVMKGDSPTTILQSALVRLNFGGEASVLVDGRLFEKKSERWGLTDVPFLEIDGPTLEEVLQIRSRIP